MKKWQLIRNDYVAAFGGKNAYLSFYTTLSKVMQNGQLVWVLGHGRYQSQNMTAAQAKDYLKRLLAIPLPVVPPDASRTFYQWETGFHTTGDPAFPIACPQD